MAINYAEIIEKSRQNQPEHAANAGVRAPVFYESSKLSKARRNVKKKRHLTKAVGRASLTKAQTRSRTQKRRRKISPEAPTMATRKQKAAARKNIKKAQAALRAKKRASHKSTKHRKTTRKRPHVVAAPKRKHRKSRKTAKRKVTRRRARAATSIRLPARRKGRKRSVSVTVKSGRKRRTRRLTVPRKARRVYVVAAERKKSKRKHTKRRVSKSAKRSAAARKAARTRARNKAARHFGGYYSAGERRKRHTGSRRRRGALENPLTGTEIFVGGICGLVGFGLGDFTDRLIATTALTQKSAATASSPALYMNTPPSSGSYAGLFNPTAITAPMDWKRWLNAVVTPGVVLVLTPYVKSPTWRSAVQFAAFGYGFRTVGKGLIDLVAKVTTSLQLGQRLYDGEMRAQVLQANNGNQSATALGNLPAAGLGNPGCACGGKCAKCQPKPGMGWPSMPRELPANAPAPTVNPPPAMQATQPPARVATPTPAAPAVPSLNTFTGPPKRASVYGNYEH